MLTLLGMLGAREGAQSGWLFSFVTFLFNNQDLHNLVKLETMLNFGWAVYLRGVVYCLVSV